MLENLIRRSKKEKKTGWGGTKEITCEPNAEASHSDCCSARVQVSRTIVNCQSRVISSWSPNSTDLYFWYLYVELAVVSPVERRNFVSVVPAAKKSKIKPFSFQNIPAMYIYKAQKQGTGRKMGKNPPKKGVFLAPLASWLSLSVSVAQHLRTNWASWPEGLEKNTFFGGFLPIFRPVPCFWAGIVYIKCLFCKKNQSNRPFLAVEVSFTKFRRV